jgi:hypothetical protein
MVQLRRRLEADVQRPLPTTVVFNFPTVDALAGYLFRELAGGDETDVPAPPAEAIVGRRAVVATGVGDEASEDELLGQLAARLDGLCGGERRRR